MRFKHPLTGRYEKINIAYMRERSHRENDPRKKFYEAILAYRDAGNEYVHPTTTSYPVNADMEIKYAVKRRWIEPV